MAFSHGDRVRILKDRSEYTGCRGLIVEEPRGPHANVSSLGHFVAIDGENGKVRPFLLADLELLRVASVRHSEATPSAESGERRD